MFAVSYSICTSCNNIQYYISRDTSGWVGRAGAMQTEDGYGIYIGNRINIGNINMFANIGINNGNRISVVSSNTIKIESFTM